jgi:peptidoglycan-associated lipoprotein
MNAAASRSVRVGAILVGALVFHACGGAPPPEPAAPAPARPTVTPPRVTPTPAAPTVDRDAEARREAARQRAILEEMVFFAYDDSMIQADAKRALDAKLPILRQNSAIRLQIAGHADERGSTEYNMALGSRRASAIRDYLIGFGLAANRFEVVSFGEGRPLDNRRADAGWSRNRRGEFVVQQGLADR